MKIDNPTSNDKYKRANQCVHVLEDTLNELYKIKVNKAKVLNYDIVDADDCGLPQTAEDSIIDDELSKILDTELSDGKHKQPIKMMEHGKDVLLSKHALIK